MCICVYMCVCVCVCVCICICICVDIWDERDSNALYTQRSNMLLNKKIQMQRPNKLHNKTQQPVEENIQLHKDPTHCIIRSNQLLTFLNTTDYVHTPKSRWRFGRDPYKKRHTVKAISKQLICTILCCLPKYNGLVFSDRLNRVGLFQPIR